MNNNSVQTVLFDLDGTLLDTAPDLTSALNAVRVEQQYEPLPLAQVRPWVSKGGIAMIEKSFNMTKHDPNFDSLRQRFLTIYANNIAEQTCLFEGMDEALKALEERNIKWGIVTNKAGWLTEPLLQQLSLHNRSVCNVSGDTLPQRKPHPAPLLHACQLAHSTPQQCIYVGDAPSDIEAGIKAGMRTLIALFGYVDAADLPAKWGATGMLKHPLDLLNWLD